MIDKLKRKLTDYDELIHTSGFKTNVLDLKNSLFYFSGTMRY